MTFLIKMLLSYLCLLLVSFLVKCQNYNQSDLSDPTFLSDQANLASAVETCQKSSNPCPSQSTCDQYANGFCCSCPSGQFGNGRTCLSLSMHCNFFSFLILLIFFLFFFISSSSCSPFFTC